MYRMWTHWMSAFFRVCWFGFRVCVGWLGSTLAGCGRLLQLAYPVARPAKTNTFDPRMMPF